MREYGYISEKIFGKIYQNLEIAAVNYYAVGLINAGKYNDAISRVYYAFFDAATAALLTKDLTVKTHHGLVVLFEQNFIKTGKINVGVGKWLARAKEAREEADYEIYKKFNKETVESGINAAKKFIENIINIIK